MHFMLMYVSFFSYEKMELFKNIKIAFLNEAKVHLIQHCVLSSSEPIISLGIDVILSLGMIRFHWFCCLYLPESLCSVLCGSLNLI